MKKSFTQLSLVISLCLLLCFSISCQDKEAMAELEEFKAQAEVEEQNKALVREYWERFGKGDDTKAVLAISHELHASDFILHTAQKEFGLNPYVVLSDFHPNIEKIIAEGNLVAICLTLQASHTDDFLGIPATGKQVSFPVNIIYRFEGSKVKEAWFDWDSLFDLMQQLGMELKPKEAEK